MFTHYSFLFELGADRVELSASSNARRPHRKGVAAAAAAAAAVAAAAAAPLPLGSPLAKAAAAADAVGPASGGARERPAPLSIPALHSVHAAAESASSHSAAAAAEGEDVFWRFSRIRDIINRSSKRQRAPSASASPRTTYHHDTHGGGDDPVVTLLQSAELHESAQERLCSEMLPLARFVSPEAYEGFATGLQVRHFIYRYILRESCSQFDSLPLTSLRDPVSRCVPLSSAVVAVDLFDTPLAARARSARPPGAASLPAASRPLASNASQLTPSCSRLFLLFAPFFLSRRLYRRNPCTRALRSSSWRCDGASRRFSAFALSAARQCSTTRVNSSSTLGR